MPTDMLRSLVRSPSRNFVVTAIAYSLAVFGLFKLGWVEAHAVAPFTAFQGRVAQATIGAPALPIAVTLACSGADAFALCAGAILAYPAAWRLRLAGTAAGFALIIVLNTIRIGTLGRAAARPVLFETLHVYVWPAILILAIGAYVIGWMALANSRSPAPPREEAAVTAINVTWVFVAWSAILVLLFVAASGLYLRSTTVLAIASFIARRAAGTLSLFGVSATANANVLWTGKGGFEVTQECISTPLIPLYFAAVMAYCVQWRWRVLALIAAGPLFVSLGIARLLTVAIPAALVGSPLFLIHAFYQILLAALVVFVVAAWQRGAAAWTVTAIACLLGGIVAFLSDPIYRGILSALALEIPFNDAQGAMATLPSFQMGVYVALAVTAMTAVAWRVFATGAAALLVVQVAAFGLLLALSRFGGLTPHIRDVRAWAIVAPLAIAVMVMGRVAHAAPRE